MKRHTYTRPETDVVILATDSLMEGDEHTVSPGIGEDWANRFSFDDGDETPDAPQTSSLWED